MTVPSNPRLLPDRESSRPSSRVARRQSGSAPSYPSGPRTAEVPKRTWYLALAALLLLANAVGYRIYRSRTRTERAPVSAPATPTAPATAAPAAPVPSPAPAPGPSEGSQALLRAHRLAALAAMEQGEYGAAERELLDAQKLEPGRSETRDLLRIVRNLQANAKKAAAPPPAPTPAPAGPVAPKPAPEPPRAKAPPKVAVARADPPRPSEPPANGTLLVVSTPPGILIQIDGQPSDVTPARIQVPPGAHSVVLVRGDTRLFERQVKVSSNAVASVDADLSAQLAPKVAAVPSTEPAEELLPVPDLDEKPAPPAPTPAPAPAPVATPTVSAKPSAVPAAAGEVYVTSPEIYGEVFINGRSYGYPPVLAKGVPAGRATVEIRINDVPRRSTVVQVEPNKRLAARLR
ncbi:MAG: PEGA domain-containing protein [Myxococcales bacterium]